MQIFVAMDTGNCVVMWSSLEAGENGSVYFSSEIVKNLVALAVYWSNTLSELHEDSKNKWPYLFDRISTHPGDLEAFKLDDFCNYIFLKKIT